MTKLVAKQGDTAPMQTVQLAGRDGTANLTGATVVMQLAGTDSPIPCDIIDAEQGTVRPSRDGLPTPPPSRSTIRVNVEFEVTYADETVQTFPEDGYLTLLVWTDLDDR